MRHLLYLCIIAALLLAACGPDHDDMLRQLNQLAEANRADSLLTDDTLALSLTDYFDRHGSANERMMAHYLLGRTYADRGEAPKAVQSYMDAADCADTTSADCDYHTLCRVYTHKAELFYYQLLPDNMIREERLAMKYAQMANDTMTYAYCYGMIAEGYDMKEMYDSALVVLKDAHNLYHSMGVYDLAASLCCSIADIYLKKKDIHKAKDALNEYEAKTKFFDENGNIEPGREMYYYIKGLYYLNCFRLDSAEFFFRKNLSSEVGLNERMVAYKGLQSIYEEKRNIDSLKKYTKAFVDAANHCHNEVEMQGMMRLQAMYDYSRSERKAYRATIDAQIWNTRFWIAILSMLIIILVSFSMYMYLRSKIKAYELEKRLKNATVVKRMQELANGNPISMPSLDDWKQLNALVNKEIPSFYYTLNTSEHKLSDMEYDVCLLIRVHMSPTEIYKLKGCSSGYVTTLRIRMLRRIFGIDGNAKDFDRRILSII